MESNNNEDTKEPKPSCCTRFKTSMRSAGRYCYNPDTKEVCGRSGISWAQICAFYLVFYAILAAFWAICMVVFIKTLDERVPTMQKMFSMLKDNPGMNYEPFFQGDPNNGTIIYFDADDNSTYMYYVNHLTNIYNIYQNRSQFPELYKASCSDDNGATGAEACMVDASALGNACTPENDFGYPDGKPCVLLRINRVFYWEPNNITLNKLSCGNIGDKASSACTNMLEFMALPSYTKSTMNTSDISVSCQGESDGDADNIKLVSFFPGGGFPAYFFPYFNQPNYTSPAVMAQFDVEFGRVSLILCQIWTRDIVHNQNDLQGSIHIELMVDKKIDKNID